MNANGKRPALPTSVEDKISKAEEYKQSGNEFFKAGELKKAASSYKKVFLYINGLHGAGSEMKQFTSAMGMGELWQNQSSAADNSSKAQAENGGGNELVAEQESEVTQLKITVNSNLALIYFNLNEYEKCLTYCEKALTLEPEHQKSQIRKAQALTELGKNLEAAHDILFAIASTDTKNRTVRETLTKCKTKIKEQNLEANKKFVGVFK